jgi:FAD binding domain
MVTDLIAATPLEDVLRRDIYDRPPIFKWTKGRVALLGDSAHAMQPNLGQGGCMAIEDAYEMAKIVSTEMEGRAKRAQPASPLDLPYERLLRKFQGKRLVRAGVIHGMARFAAIAASTYKAYLGEQWKCVSGECNSAYVLVSSFARALLCWAETNACSALCCDAFALQLVCGKRMGPVLGSALAAHECECCVAAQRAACIGDEVASAADTSKLRLAIAHIICRNPDTPTRVRVQVGREGQDPAPRPCRRPHRDDGDDAARAVLGARRQREGDPRRGPAAVLRARGQVRWPSVPRCLQPRFVATSFAKSDRW